MFRPLCICAEIPVFDLKTKIVVLMHWREDKLTTNSARLACMALTNSSLHQRGRIDGRLQTEKLITPGESAALLFPTEDSIELTEETASRLARPLTLFVPDGSWRQAQKVSRREPALKDIPRLRVPLGLPSTYRLRHSPHPQNLSTFEAIARALGVLEGPEVQAKLEKLFLTMVERRLWSRGTLNIKDCTTTIPEAALEAARIAGAAGSKRVSRKIEE